MCKSAGGVFMIVKHAANVVFLEVGILIHSLLTILPVGAIIWISL